MSKHGVFQLARCAPPPTSSLARNLTVHAQAHAQLLRVLGQQPRRAVRAACGVPAQRPVSLRSPSDFAGAQLAALRAANPQLELTAALRPGRHPFALAEYGARRAARAAEPATSPAAYAVNGHSRSVDLKNLEAAEVAWHVSFLRSEKGHRTGNKISRQLTSRPSIQGPWAPA